MTEAETIIEMEILRRQVEVLRERLDLANKIIAEQVADAAMLIAQLGVWKEPV